MAHVDFAWELGAGTGHVTTLMPVARALRARGHEVRFLLKDLEAGADLEGAAGIPREGAPVWVGPARHPNPLNFGEILENFGYADPAALRKLIEAWRERLSRTALVVANVAPAAHLAALTLGIPSLEISQGFHVPPPAMPSPPLRDWEAAPRAQLEAADASVLAAINSVLAAYGVPSLETLGELFNACALLQTYPELDIYAERGPADYFGVPQSGEGESVPGWPAGSGPRVFGYLYNYYAGLAPLLDSLEQLRAPSLIFCRDIDPALARKHQSGSVHLCTEPMAVSKVLPGCDLVVCHGSHQMTAQALLAGKPALMLPTQLEQFLIMRRVVRQGAGLGISPDTPGADFGAAIVELAGSPGYAGKAQAFARRYARHDRNASLATMIERCETALHAVAEAPPIWDIRSAVPGVEWPALPAAGGAAVLALLHQLESTQWLSGARLAELQLRQLDGMLRHAHDTCPFYRQHWSGSYDPACRLTLERFANLPLLSRRDLQQRYADIKSSAPPAAHGKVGETMTSGSMGAPVRAAKTQLTALYWTAFTLRDHLWHERDLGAKLAAIRGQLHEGEAASWGTATRGIVATGPLATLNSTTPISKQLDWLRRHDPVYLLSNASNAVELARSCLIHGIRLPALREVRTISDMLSEEGRGLMREAWGVRVTDTYSAEEIGYIALQCPRHEHFHVQSEGVLLELLDERGAPCALGQVGRVVLTDLHNFAMPLVRYEIGDYAEAGPPCACGRGLPVIRRIVGRKRNMLVTASGDRLRPYFGAKHILDIAPILQQQYVQKEYDLIEARFVAAAPFSAEQEARLRKRILSGLPRGMRLKVAYFDHIPRSAGGKYEDFICEVSAP